MTARGRLAALVAAALACAPQPPRAQEANPGATRAVTILAPREAPAPGADNPAGLNVEILPAERIPLGAKVTFRVGARKSGYLILLEVDASGKVTQRFPNLYSMALPAGANDKSNLITPARPTLIPNRLNPFAAFEYVAEPPAGAGFFAALLSPRPVQFVDLPDVPQQLLGTPQAEAFLIEEARRLRVVGRDDKSAPADPGWSFAFAPYAITP
ncbi:DUF4384 domain-containing protein [Methylocella sp.]|uniref:DUF4384 domain-containing protein n=1 Tax=Methylocella sp. TaxID=1978226 RepID=UPI0037843618